ncbi:uncharacterized protein LOC5510141 [Nematostella vectensis]|uniref:uncharacterized protein LOC5510141 n=1 Tax=Nematostella vectensis TaxID=45351 RepID=UPI00207789C0|nr:uncharacterized protein LOC5510141 [Nematostella vectensis]
MVLIKRNKENKRQIPPQVVKYQGDGKDKATSTVEKQSLFQRYWFLKYLILVALAPAFMNHAALSRESRELQPLGELYDVGWGQKLFMGCVGKGRPTVLFDAPTGMSSDAWALIAPKLAKTTRVCVYDRAGLGFSDRPFINRSQPDSGKSPKGGLPYTTEKMVEDFHRLFTGSSKQPGPFLLVGAELGAVNMRFYTQLFDSDVMGFVSINPLVEGMFDIPEKTWVKHWQGRHTSMLQTLQFLAAVGLSRVALILGLMTASPVDSGLVSADVIARQKHLLCKPAHLSSAVEEFYFANESLSQMRTLCRIKPFPSHVGVTVVTSGAYSTKPGSEELNRVWSSSQDHMTKVIHAGSDRVQLPGSAESALFQHADVIARVIERRVIQWRKPSGGAAKQ